VIVAMFLAQLSFGQITSTTITLNMDNSGQDAGVAGSGSANSNFGLDRYMYAFHNTDSRAGIVYRTFIEFDLTSIPKNAIITSANLKLVPHSIDPIPSYNYYVQRVDAGWNKSTLTWNNQPGAFTSDGVSVYSPASQSGATHSVNVTSHVQNMVYNPSNNNGWRIRLMDESSSGTRGVSFRSSNYTTSSSRPQLTISYVEPPLTATFDEGKNEGSIVVDAPDGNLPYTYLLGYNELPEMSLIWNALKDSYGGSSIDFQRGRVNSTSFEFNSLSSGRYFVGVYDNNGQKILGEDIYVGPNSKLYESVNITESESDLSVTPGYSKGFATMLALIKKNNTGGFEFEISNYNDDVLIGFNKEFDTIPYVDSLFEYAIKVEKSGIVKLFKSGVEVWAGASKLNDRLSLIKQNGKIIFIQSNKTYVELGTYNNLDGNYKIEAVLKESSSFLSKPLFINYVKPDPIKIKMSSPLCPEKEGEVIITFPPTDFKYQNYNYIITNLITGDQFSGSSIAPLIVTLPIGSYSITSSYSYLSGGVWSSVFVSTQHFSVGHTVDWTNFVNISPISSTLNSIQPTNINNLGTAISYNESVSSTTNWVEFNWSGPFNNIPPYLVYSNTWVELSLKNDLLSPLTKARVYNPGYGLISGFVNVSNGSSSINFIAHNEEPVRIEFTTSSLGVTDNFKISHNGSNWTETVTPSIAGTFKIFSELKGKVILKDAITSFCGANYVYNYADLTKKLDGGYYLSRKGFVKFIYTEEYKDLDGNLTYQVFNSDNQEVVSSTLLSQTVGFGDNRYTLDFSCLSTLSLSNGFYVLKVTNEKNESFYLRIKIIDNC